MKQPKPKASTLARKALRFPWRNPYKGKLCREEYLREKLRELARAVLREERAKRSSKPEAFAPRHERGVYDG